MGAITVSARGLRLPAIKARLRGQQWPRGWLTVRGNHGQRAAVAAKFFTAFAAAQGLAGISGGPVADRLGRVRTR